MNAENEKFIAEWNKKSSTLSEVMKRCGISDMRTVKTKVRSLKKYLTCTREEGKLSARGVAIGEESAEKEVKVASKTKVTAEVAEEKKEAAKGKKVTVQFKNKRGDVVNSREVVFSTPAQLSDMIREFAAAQSFDKTVIEGADGSSINPSGVNDGDIIVVRPNISGASYEVVVVRPS